MRDRGFTIERVMTARTLAFGLTCLLGSRLSLGLEYDGTLERSLSDGSIDSPWLLRISLSSALGADENVKLSIRPINGNGGYAAPGANFAAAYHKRYRHGNDLYVNFGTPAATQRCSASS